MTATLKPADSVFKLLKTATAQLQAAQLDENSAKVLLMGLMNWDNTNLLTHYRNPLSEADFERFNQGITRLLNAEPVQYVLGSAPFYGHDFVVDQRVLIPRPETEELADWILTDQSADNLQVLDLGTGSGAIALSLKLACPSWKVTATDISNEALQVAKQNAINLDADVDFMQSDLFAEVNGKFDVIVANPPYIATDERQFMDKSVLDYEPDLALFAENDGLTIYQQLAQQVGTYLQPNGALYLEIGFQQGTAVQTILQQANPKRNVELKKDLTGHDRMIKMS